MLSTCSNDEYDSAMMLSLVVAAPTRAAYVPLATGFVTISGGGLSAARVQPGAKSPASKPPLATLFEHMATKWR